MKQTVYKDDFCQAFKDAGRENQFSYEGLGELFDWIERLDDDTGTESELDVIALCCEFNEEHYTDTASNYGIDIEGQDEEEALQTVIDYLNDHTLFVACLSDDSVIYAAF